MGRCAGGRQRNGKVRTDRPMLSDIVVESAKLAHVERHARIKQCVAVGRHDPAKLPLCSAFSPNELIPYCDHCWSLIDAQGLTWSWPMPERNIEGERRNH